MIDRQSIIHYSFRRTLFPALSFFLSDSLSLFLSLSSYPRRLAIPTIHFFPFPFLDTDPFSLHQLTHRATHIIILVIARPTALGLGKLL
jgi:hypothetical protein